MGGKKKKKRNYNYDMGCDCGKLKETQAEKEACLQSSMLEAPDGIVGGCQAGHTPWYVFLEITGESLVLEYGTLPPPEFE